LLKVLVLIIAILFTSIVNNPAHHVSHLAANSEEHSILNNRSIDRLID